jgi:lysine 2,3-aminomutase
MRQVEDQFAEKTTRFIRELAQRSPAIEAIYFRNPDFERDALKPDADLYLEQKNTVSKGLIAKYPGRALFLLSYTCAANCRYCERQDRVGVGRDADGRLGRSDILEAVDYLAAHPEISEVIFSGGDPLTNMPGLRIACDALSAVDSVKVLRIHTRFPMQFPQAVKIGELAAIARAKPAFYLSLHVDHPDELTPETESIIHSLREAGFILLSQSVFLKGVNDRVEILSRLFSRLFELGVRPYYIYHCAPIATTRHFMMRISDEIRIMSALRETISGLAVPQHIIEMQHTSGKIVVPSNHWDADLTQARDFSGQTVALDHYEGDDLVSGV